MKRLRIVLADDHPIFRDGLVRSLEESGEFEVAGTAGSADEAIALTRGLGPDLVLLDLSMPGGGIAAARAIARLDPAPRIVMLTVSEEETDVTDAMAAGALGYVLKGVSSAELRRILQRVAAGEAHITPSLAAHVLSVLRNSRDKPADPTDDLSARETEILKAVARGLSNKEVALELGIQEKTVKHYMTSIMGKLHARNRVEAALIAHQVWSRS